MQYSTPQFIEEEGKIVFFLTFRQFFILVGAGAICFALFYLAPFWVFVPGTLLVGGLAAAIAFLKIGNESIIKVVLHFIGFTIGKKNYIWQKKETPYPITDSAKQSKVGEIKRIMETKK